MSNSQIHIISLNCRGLRTKEKQRNIFKWSHDQNVDILLLQETHLTDVNNADCLWEGLSYHSIGTNYSKGVSILFKKGLVVNVNAVEIDKVGRYIILNATVNDKKYLLVNIYSHNEQKFRSKFIRNLREKVKKHKKKITNATTSSLQVILTAS